MWNPYSVCLPGPEPATCTLCRKVCFVCLAMLNLFQKKVGLMIELRSLLGSSIAFNNRTRLSKLRAFATRSRVYEVNPYNRLLIMKAYFLPLFGSFSKLFKSLSVKSMQNFGKFPNPPVQTAAVSRVITQKTNLFLKIILFIGTERCSNRPFCTACRFLTPNSNYENADRICSQTSASGSNCRQIRKFTIQTSLMLKVWRNQKFGLGTMCKVCWLSKH